MIDVISTFEYISTCLLKVVSCMLVVIVLSPILGRMCMNVEYIITSIIVEVILTITDCNTNNDSNANNNNNNTDTARIF